MGLFSFFRKTDEQKAYEAAWLSAHNEPHPIKCENEEAFHQWNTGETSSQFWKRQAKELLK